jgi:hypothetical protein
VADLPGFVGPSGASRSAHASCERSINFYLEPESNNPKSLLLYSFPGLQPVAELPTGPIRGLYESSTGLVFAVTSSRLYEVFAGFTFIDRHAVPNGTNYVSMCDDGTSLVLSVEGQCLVYNMTTQAIVTVAPGEPTLTFGRVAYLDGYIVSNEPGTRRFWVSNLNAPTIWGALSYYDAQARPDDIVTLYVDHRELWLYGSQSTEVWTPTGRPLNDLQGIGPFARMQGVFIEQGIAAPWAVQTLDNTLYYLGGVPRGDGPVWKSQGYQPVRVSNHALESALSTLDSVAGAISFVARHGSHAWYGLWLADLETTWLYDTLTGAWTELAALADDGTLGPFPANQHCYAFGVHLWGSATTGTLWTWNPGYHYYGTRERYCARISPWVRDDESGSKITFASVMLRCLTGQGLDGGVVPGSDPQYRLSWTTDGTRWSFEHPRSAGKIGEAERRVTWRQLGQDRARAFRIVSTEPILHCWRGLSINGV